jgi:hypothetical protein
VDSEAKRSSYASKPQYLIPMRALLKMYIFAFSPNTPRTHVVSAEFVLLRHLTSHAPTNLNVALYCLSQDLTVVHVDVSIGIMGDKRTVVSASMVY